MTRPTEREQKHRVWPLLLVTMLGVLPVASTVSAAVANCVPAALARDMIANEAILPLPEALRRAGSVQPDQIVGVELCRSEDDRLVYEVEIQEAGGESRFEAIPSTPTGP